MPGRLTSIEELVARARQLAARDRRILGIAGQPGAGKSTLADFVVSQLDSLAVVVPMDGFHLANKQLARLRRADRKGAPDTFDAFGYLALLRRLRTNGDPVVYAPEFQRELDEPTAGSIAILQETPLVVTEGNYLLLDDHPWGLIRELLDEVWYVELNDAERVGRLVNRHVRHGKSTHEAQDWVWRSDEANARMIAQTRDRADILVTGLSLLR